MTTLVQRALPVPVAFKLTSRVEKVLLPLECEVLSGLNSSFLYHVAWGISDLLFFKALGTTHP